jgi:hypothetical protein
MKMVIAGLSCYFPAPIECGAALIMTAKLNDDVLASLADVLSRIAYQPQIRLQEVLPWHWAAKAEHCKVAA